MGDDATLWSVDAAALEGITACRARDLLIDCFYAAQAHTFVRSRERMHMEHTEREVRDTVESLIRMKFRDLGCDWDDPAPEDIGQVVEALAAEASAWGTPPHIVEHHMAEMRKVQEHLYAS